MKLPFLKSVQKGFTLVELIIVVAMLAVLLAVVLVALNPQARIQDSNNARRRSDVNAIVNAIASSMADNDGAEPTGVGGVAINATEKQLGTGTDAVTCPATAAPCGSAAAACINLATSLADYMGAIPTDPQGGTDAATRYTIVQTNDATNGPMTVRACNAQGGINIFATR